ncbi:Leukocyte receptor cluster (LRC) member 8 [Perkinsus chesapeaki]|uniref:Leukocyte receptor cluster (LRC) member 8 n=1 Tax=Perkinsus chesapeaki TaxID=330153 RepID=A0A7J6MJP8_PERCH|nr:Leukocyte receptor cluster (LRC) member 8 [Perkinsus chesapeaki]
MPRRKFGQKVTVYSSGTGGTSQRSCIDADERKQRAARAARFRDTGASADTPRTKADSDEIPTPERYVQGTCTVLEKDYFRLTGPARPAAVRPPSVLAAAFDRLRELYPLRGWEYISGQLRAIRQDMKVQGLDGSELSLNVYTVNARWSLESQDLVQFIQCMTAVTRQIHSGSGALPRDVQAEFLAYEVVYIALQDFYADQLRFLRRLRDLPVGIKSHPYLRCGLRIRSWMASGNYYRVLRAYTALRSRPKRLANSVPSHLLPLIELFLEDLRLRLLRSLTKAYVQLGISLIVKWLGFATVDECKTFLLDHEVPIEEDSLVCKSCLPVLERRVQMIERRRLG